MFSKRDGVTDSMIRSRRGGGMPSIISGDLHVVGDLRTDGEIQIDGIVEGDVSGHALTVGEGAKVIGDVDADDVVIRGTVIGSVRARRVEVAGGAKVVGDIWHDILTVADGARLDGRIRRGKAPRAAGRKKRQRSAGSAGDDGGNDTPMVWRRQGHAGGLGP